MIWPTGFLIAREVCLDPVGVVEDREGCLARDMQRSGPLQ